MAGAVDWLQTETKGTVLIKSAAELKDFSKGEENLLEAQVKTIKATGVNVCSNAWCLTACLRAIAANVPWMKLHCCA